MAQQSREMALGQMGLAPASSGLDVLWRLALFLAAVGGSALLITLDQPVLAIGVMLVATLLSFGRWLFKLSTLTYAVVLTVLLVPASIYRPPLDLPFGLDIYRVVVMAMLVLWFGALLVDERVRLRRTPVDTPLLALFTVIGLSMLANLPDLSTTLGYGASVKRLFYFSSLVLLMYAIVSTVRTNRDVHRLITFVIVIGVGLAVLGVVERMTTFNVFQHLDSYIPVLKRSVAEGSGRVLTRAGGVRVAGSAAHPIAFAAILGMIQPLALTRLIRAEDFVKQAAYAAAAGLIGIAMILTGSRTAFTGFIIVSLVLLLGAGERRNRLLVTLGITFVAIYIAVPGMLGTMFKWLTPSFIMQQETDNPAGRLADYSRVMEYFWRKPALGMGFGAFVPEKFFYVDNQYLKFVAEIGALGIVTFGWFLVRSLHKLFMASRRAVGEVSADLLGVTASVAVFAAVCATFDTLGFPQVTYVFFILLSLGLALLLNQHEQEEILGTLQADADVQR